MILIRDIAILDAWKDEMRCNGTLSMRELISKVEVLEQRLERGIRLVSDQISNDGTSKNDKKRSHADTLLITRTFAFAATVYLHVTVSGANPAVLEIIAGVQQTLEALKALPSNLLRCVVWPLCIAGCMAAPTEEISWQRFVHTSGMTSSAQAFGNVSQAWSVVETCWIMRKYEKASTGKRLETDWTSAMQTMGYRVLLI